MFENIERNGILKNGFQILNPLNRHEFWFIVRESNLIVTPKTPEMCRVSYTKTSVKCMVFCIAYTLLELALTGYTATLLHCYIVTLLNCYIATLLHLLHCYIATYICYTPILPHCYIATMLRCYIATLLHLLHCYICYVATLLHCYIASLLHCFITTLLHCYIATLLHCYIATFATFATLLHCYIATLLHFKLKQPWSDPNQINPTQNYKATATFNGFILSRSKSDFQTPKLQSYRHISNTLPEFQIPNSKATLLHCYIATLLHCYIATLLYCYIATLLNCYICYIVTLLHWYISNLNRHDLIQIRSTQPKIQTYTYFQWLHLQ